MKYCLACATPFAATASACPSCGMAPEVKDGFPHHAPGMAVDGSGFRPEYFAELARLEASNFWFRARNNLIVDVLVKHRLLRRNFLEIGCGTGFVLSGIARAFPGIALSGSELFAEGLKHSAERLPGANLMQMDARTIPYQDEFDAIGAFDVIEHIEEDTAVIAAMKRALVPGGGALFTVPQHPWLWSDLDEHACHVRRYRRGELEGKLRDAGMKVIFSTSFVTLLMPLLAASRFRMRKSAEQAATAQLNPPAAINATLDFIMRCERQLIRMGIRFPFGGTRLVLAVKS
jgi:SAM-dependent methyltransferase